MVPFLKIAKSNINNGIVNLNMHVNLKKLYIISSNLPKLNFCRVYVLCLFFA